MSGYQCKYCEWLPEGDLSNQEKFAILNAHKREEHSGELRAAMSAGRAKKREGQASVNEAPTKSKKEASQDSPDGSVKVRLSSEQITLPGELFVLYHWVRNQFPNYEASKGEWLEQVVATWAIDHGEEILLPSIPGVFINRALDTEPTDEFEDTGEYEEDDDAEESEEEYYPVADRPSEQQPFGLDGFFR